MKNTTMEKGNRSRTLSKIDDNMWTKNKKKMENRGRKVKTWKNNKIK